MEHKLRWHVDPSLDLLNYIVSHVADRLLQRCNACLCFIARSIEDHGEATIEFIRLTYSVYCAIVKV